MRLPISKGMRIGLLGGSFNPPHQGHIDIAKTALKRLKLDRIIWLVTPQNPLKTLKPLSCNRRIALIKNLTRHPQFIISKCEEDFNLKYTSETVSLLTQRYPHNHFTLITGSDNVRTMPYWHKWKQLLDICDWAIIARPGSGYNIRFQKAFKTPFSCKKYYIIHPMNKISSTILRENSEK